MRKLSIFLLALVAILGLSGCFNNLPTGGQTQPSDDQGKTEVEDQLDTSKTYHLVGGNFGWGDAVQHGVHVLAPTTVAELKANEAYASVATTLEGKEFSDLGYMSSSPAYGTSFAKHLRYSIILEIAAPKGTECAYINQLSSFYNAEMKYC